MRAESDTCEVNGLPALWAVAEGGGGVDEGLAALAPLRRAMFFNGGFAGAHIDIGEARDFVEHLPHVGGASPSNRDYRSRPPKNSA